MVGLTVVGTYVLSRMRFGNWIYASGGNVDSARKTGVPVARVKITLFICTAMAAALVALLSSFAVDGTDVTNGADKMFQAPVAAVIGGALLTGGYGSVVGTFFGALLFGMVSQGFFFTNIDDNWFQAFLGGMLLIAVFVNDYSAETQPAGAPLVSGQAAAAPRGARRRQAVRPGRGAYRRLARGACRAR